MTYPTTGFPLSALHLADGTTTPHSVEHGRVIGVWENVKHYGAKGDGTDDTAAIQAAITAAGVGGTVRFPDASPKYLVTATLTPLDGQHWIGAGHRHWSATTAHPWISYSGTGTAVNLSNSSGVRISGIRLECTNNSGGVVGFLLRDSGSGVNWTILEGCTVIGPVKGTGVGVQMDGQIIATSFTSIRDSSFYKWATGLLMSGFSNSNKVDNTTFHSCTTGIDLHAVGTDTVGGSNNTFVQVELDSSCTSGINLANSAGGNLFLHSNDDNTTNPLTIASGVTRTTFVGCGFGNGAIADSSGANHTHYLNCYGGWPAGGATQITDGQIDFAETGADPFGHTVQTNRARLYARDNGSGKTQLVVKFPTGVVQVLATEP